MKGILLAAAIAAAAPAGAAITQVDYASLAGAYSTNLSDTASGPRDDVVYSAGLGFAEHFTGQTVSDLNGSDLISGDPTSLSLVPGDPGHNLTVFPGGYGVSAVGPTGGPTGALSLLFSSDQSQFGVGYVGSNPGGYNINFSFFRGDGSLIQTVTLPSNVNGINNGAEVRYGFLSDAANIRGVSIWNNDLGGIGFDVFRFDVASNLNAGVPEPTTWAMMLLGFGAIGGAARAARPRRSSGSPPFRSSSIRS